MAIKLLLAFVLFLTPEFTPFTSIGLSNSSSGPSSIRVAFDRLNGLRTGAPVVSDGELVGTVLAITPASSAKNSQFSVQLKIAPQHRSMLKRGTVALISSPLTMARVRPEIVVELVVPESSPNIEKLAEGAKISGFSSYKAYEKQQPPVQNL